ncbi:hypothetical protein ACFL0A_01575 [Patescibacteria group bacterium]
MIYILGGIHCDKKLYNQIIKILKKIKPDLVCLEELTNDKEVIRACNYFIKGKISLVKFKELTKFEKYWFDFEPYKKLFLYLQKNKIKIYPIDHKLKERIKLIKLEKKILKELKENKNIAKLKKMEEKISVFDREDKMAKNISKGIKKFKSKNTCVIIGINHTKRIKKSLSTLGYKVKSKDISNKRNIDGYLDRIYKYAVKRKIESLKIPPFVPVFVLVFRKIEKNVK